jgi:superfamily II DNA or RNA helicase
VAAVQNLPPILLPGELVDARGERWHVRAARRASAVTLVTLDGAGLGNQPRHTTLLLPFDRIDRVGQRSPVRRRRHVVIGRALAAMASAHPADGLWSVAQARMNLLPWQLAPALSVLSGATRLLLADAVGLGKTIEAGLVVAELTSRGLAERTLVLTPPSIRGQWVDELRDRLSLPAEVLDLAALLERQAQGRVGAHPWADAGVVVSSIDLVKRPEMRTAIERAPFDVLVVDEAHHLTPGTDRHALVSRLAADVPWLVLVTATPHSGDAAAYRALLELGRVSSVPDAMRIFRRTHADARLPVARRTRQLRIRPTPAERALHEGVLAYARDLCRGPSGHLPGVQLLASLLARRATSSPWAALLTLRRRHAALTADQTAAAATPQRLPWDEEELEDEAVPCLDVAGVPNADAERSRLRVLIDLADAATRAPSKLARLRALVRRVHEPVIIFSEFRDTIEAYAGAIAADTSVACLHGGLSGPDRRQALEAFRSGGARVLLTTDVAGEGVNLQAGSRTVITNEWPWNPLRLEQRIGRVHRLGQTRPVHALHLTAHDSYEETVVSHLQQRARQADTGLAHAAADTERHIAADLLGAPEPQTGPATDTRDLSPVDHDLQARVTGEVARLQSVRRLFDRGGSGDPAVLWAWPARGRPPTHVVVLVDVSHHGSAGGLRASHIVAVRVTPDERPSTRRGWRDLCRRLAADTRIAVAARAAAPAPGHDPWPMVRARLSGARAVRRDAAPRAVQPSLFDRRALRHVEQDAIARAAWDTWHDRLAMRLQQGQTRLSTRIVAVLPCTEWTR